METEVREVGRWSPRNALGLLGLLAGVVAAIMAVALLGGKDAESAATAKAEPAVVEDVEIGAGPPEIALTQQAAARLGIETTPVRESAEGKLVPYAALIYGTNGDTWVYTSPQRLRFLRAPVVVERIEGGRAYLRSGPPEDTEIVTVGAAEVYGTEVGLGH